MVVARWLMMTLIFLEFNFGGELPIGSNNNFINENLSKSSNTLAYLNAGTGKPWAGQTMANVSAKVTPNALILDFTLNFGGALPMGSKRFYKFKNIICVLGVPECWNGKALSWARKGKHCIFDDIKSIWFVLSAKLWDCTTNWFYTNQKQEDFLNIIIHRK